MAMGEEGGGGGLLPAAETQKQLLKGSNNFTQSEKSGE